MRETTVQSQTLERELFDLKCEKQDLHSDLEAVKLEKKHLQKVLEISLDEKKQLTEKANQFREIGEFLGGAVNSCY